VNYSELHKIKHSTKSGKNKKSSSKDKHKDVEGLGQDGPVWGKKTEGSHNRHRSKVDSAGSMSPSRNMSSRKKSSKSPVNTSENSWIGGATASPAMQGTNDFNLSPAAGNRPILVNVEDSVEQFSFLSDDNNSDGNGDGNNDVQLGRSVGAVSTSEKGFSSPPARVGDSTWGRPLGLASSSTESSGEDSENDRKKKKGCDEDAEEGPQDYDQLVVRRHVSQRSPVTPARRTQASREGGAVNNSVSSGTSEENSPILWSKRSDASRSGKQFKSPAAYSESSKQQQQQQQLAMRQSAAPGCTYPSDTRLSASAERILVEGEVNDDISAVVVAANAENLPSPPSIGGSRGSSSSRTNIRSIKESSGTSASSSLSPSARGFSRPKSMLIPPSEM
jgi:hypothetical protein